MPSTPNKQNSAVGFIAVVVLSSVICGLVYSHNSEPRLENDVAQAIIAARYLAMGEGYVTDSLYYPENYRPDLMPAPQTIFPPGQSFAIVFWERFSIDGIEAAFMTSLISLFLIPISLYAFCIRCRVRSAVAVTVCLLWCGVVTAWENTYHSKTDVVFLMLTMFSAMALVRPVRRPVAMAFASGCLAAAALLTRYAGLFFMLSAALAIAFDCYRHRTRRELAELVAFCIPSGSTLIVLFARNYYFTGDMKGGNSYHPNKLFVDSVRELYVALVELTGLSHVWSPWNPAEILCGTALLLAVWFGWKHRRGLKISRPDLSIAVDQRGPVLCVIYPVVTVALLVWLELTTCVGLRARMFMTVVPFVFVLAAMVPQLVVSGSKPNTHFRLVGVLLVLAFLLGQVKAAPRIFSRRPNYTVLKAACDQPVSDTVTLEEFLQSEISFEHPVMGNEPQVLGEILQRPVVGLSSAHYTARVWNSKEVLRRIRRFDVEWVVNFDSEHMMNSEIVPFYAALSEGDVPEWLELHQSHELFQLFRVKPKKDCHLP